MKYRYNCFDNFMFSFLDNAVFRKNIFLTNRRLKSRVKCTANTRNAVGNINTESIYGASQMMYYLCNYLHSVFSSL